MNIAERRTQRQREAVGGLVAEVAPELRDVLAGAGAELARAAGLELRTVLEEELAVASLTFRAGLAIGVAAGALLLFVIIQLARGTHL